MLNLTSGLVQNCINIIFNTYYISTNTQYVFQTDLSDELISLATRPNAKLEMDKLVRSIWIIS